MILIYSFTVKVIQQRWKSARDAYRKDRTKIATTKSGQSAKIIKKYIYFENLQFLNKTLDLNETDTNFQEEGQNSETNMSENEEGTNEVIYEEDIGVTTQNRKRKKKQDNIDEKLLQFLSDSKKSEDNGNRAFLESLLPTLDTFDEAKSLQFRAEVLRILMEIKNVVPISQMTAQMPNFSSQRKVNTYSYSVANRNPSYMSDSASGYSDINVRPQSNVSSPLSSNEYGYSTMPPQDYLPPNNQHDETSRHTLLELTGVNIGGNNN